MEALKEPTLDTLCDETEEGPARHSCSQQRLSASGPRALGGPLHKASLPKLPGPLAMCSPIPGQHHRERQKAGWSWGPQVR